MSSDIAKYLLRGRTVPGWEPLGYIPYQQSLFSSVVDIICDLFSRAPMCWKEVYIWLIENKWQTNQINTRSQRYIRIHLTTENNSIRRKLSGWWTMWYYTMDFFLCVIFFFLLLKVTHPLLGEKKTNKLPYIGVWKRKQKLALISPPWDNDSYGKLYYFFQCSLLSPVMCGNFFLWKRLFL